MRATNTGISVVISPAGELLDTADVDARATLVATVVPDGHTRTLMVRWGDWFGPTALATGLVLLAVSLRPRRARSARRATRTVPPARRRVAAAGS